MLIGSANLRKMIIMAEKSLSTLYKRARKLQDFFRMIIHISLPYTAKTIGTSSGGGGIRLYTERPAGNVCCYMEYVLDSEAPYFPLDTVLKEDIRSIVTRPRELLAAHGSQWVNAFVLVSR